MKDRGGAYMSQFTDIADYQHRGAGEAGQASDGFQSFSEVHTPRLGRLESCLVRDRWSVSPPKRQGREDRPVLLAMPNTKTGGDPGRDRTTPSISLSA